MNATPKWIKYISIAILVLGLILRFHNLDLHPYWNDETYTSVQMYGHDYNTKEFKSKIHNRIITAQDLREYLYPSPTASTGDTVALIAKKEPQLSPLYFILDRFWVSTFGNSIAIIRSFSAVIGVLVALAFYWLSMELFHSKTTAWITVALVAVSPFHLIYSQEARPPMLWILTIVLSHIALLRALRQPKAGNWILYSLSIVLSLYSYLFSLLVLAGHVLFVLIYERFRFSKKVISFLVSTLAALICFSPWLLIFSSNVNKAYQWEYGPIYKMPFWYITRWLHNLGIVFADFNVGEISPKVAQISYSLILLLILFIVILAWRFFYRNGDKLTHIFLTSAIIIPLLPLFFKDLIVGGGVTQVIRYLSPCWIAIELIVAYWLGNQIESAKFPKLAWQSLLVLLLLLGLSSDILMTSSELWWNKLDANFFRQYADQVIAKAKNPLIVNDDSYIPAAVSLSTSVDPKVRFLLFSEDADIRIPNGESEVFLFRPSKKLVKKFQKNYKLEHVPLKDAYPGGGITSEHFYRVITN